jgi:hypothetical protein
VRKKVVQKIIDSLQMALNPQFSIEKLKYKNDDVAAADENVCARRGESLSVGWRV